MVSTPPVSAGRIDGAADKAVRGSDTAKLQQCATGDADVRMKTGDVGILIVKTADRRQRQPKTAIGVQAGQHRSTGYRQVVRADHARMVKEQLTVRSLRTSPTVHRSDL